MYTKTVEVNNRLQRVVTLRKGLGTNKYRFVFVLKYFCAIFAALQYIGT